MKSFVNRLSFYRFKTKRLKSHRRDDMSMDFEKRKSNSWNICVIRHWKSLEWSRIFSIVQIILGLLSFFSTFIESFMFRMVGEYLTFDTICFIWSLLFEMIITDGMVRSLLLFTFTKISLTCDGSYSTLYSFSRSNDHCVQCEHCHIFSDITYRTNCLGTEVIFVSCLISFCSLFIHLQIWIFDHWMFISCSTWFSRSCWWYCCKSS